MKKILIAILAILTFTQCEPAAVTPGGDLGFTTDVTQYGIYNNTTAVIAYDINQYQTSTIKSPYRFVMQSDDQTKYFVASFTALPTDINMTVDVDLKAVGVTGFKDGVRKMTLLKQDTEKAWLWSKDESLGVVVAVPLY